MSTVKTFKTDFYKLLTKLQSITNFAFARYSDGEMDVMQNLELRLGENTTQVGTNFIRVGRSEEDHKHFNPRKHQFHRRKLIDAYKFKKENYYVGLSCRCCVGEKNFKYMVDLRGGDDDHLTWANLWCNSNYPLFLDHIVPELAKHDIIMVCHKSAVVDDLPFRVRKDFRIGSNAMIDNYGLIEDVKTYIRINNIENSVFLFAASTLSNYLAYELFKEFDNNTYIDIGTALNPHMKLAIDRGYLKAYWQNNKKGGTLNKTCVW